MSTHEADNPIRTVVVGYGYAGRQIHVPLVRLERAMRLHGVCSGDPAKRETIRSQLDCRTYAKFDEVIADNAVNLVILATPNALHATQAIAAMSAGKHVVVDKPMCLTVGEADQMIQASRKTGRLLRVFHNRRLDGDFLTLRSLIEQGELGRVRWMELSWQKYGLPRTWRQVAGVGGGRLYDLGSHLIDQALILNAGLVKSVFCRQHREFEGCDIESHSMLTMAFADGATAIIDTTCASRIPKPRYVVLGDRATFLKYGVDHQEAALAAGNIDAAADDPSEYGQLDDGHSRRTIPTLHGSWRGYYGEVAVAIRTGLASPASTAEDAGQRLLRMQIAVLQAAGESARSGKTVELD
jgi:scyllo-inositol 2-dehydrogenase (NADP+)